MFKDMRLGTKIGCGFGVILVITIVLGAVTIVKMTDVREETTILAKEYIPQVDAMVELEEDIRELMFLMRGYGYTGSSKDLEAAKKAMEDIKKEMAAAKELAARSPHLVKLKEVAGALDEKLTGYFKFIAQTKERVEGLAGNRKMLEEAAGTFMKGADAYLEEMNKKMTLEIQAGAEQGKLNERLEKITLINDVIKLGILIRLTNAKAQMLRDSQFTQEALGIFPKIDQKLTNLLTSTSQETDKKTLEGIKQAAQRYKAAMTDPSANWQALLEVNGKRLEVANAFLAITKDATKTALKLIDKTSEETLHSLSAASWMTTFGLGLAVILGVTLAFFITRGITLTINRIVGALSDGADQVSSASGQVSAASQQLAEGSSQQAASLEETSSSLEEMSSMTKQNADNAAQANSLMNETYRVVEQANQAMSELTMSMKEISSASDETAKIIKTIDEIAFQTNLLALNAAVEAARAGEAGAGFAVVADEVRNLAMRAAEAAKNTANLIEGTVAKIKEGSELVHKTGEAFTLVASSTNRAKELVGEIAAASNEQAQGVDQISKAVAEMDKVVQQNAANAEESASASEELSAQAAQVQGVVGELVVLVGGNHRGSSGPANGDRSRYQPEGRTAQAQKALTLTTRVKKTMTALPGNGVRRQAARVVTPKQVITVDEGEFKNF